MIFKSKYQKEFAMVFAVHLSAVIIIELLGKMNDLLISSFSGKWVAVMLIIGSLLGWTWGYFSKKPWVRMNVEGALSDINRFVGECLERNEKIEFKYIGMTMSNAWGTMFQVLELLAEKHAPNVIFHVAMLSEEWLNEQHSKKIIINSNWTADSVRMFKGKILSFKPEHAEKLKEKMWDIDVKHYSCMPCLHGVLINDKFLVMGSARWEGGVMYAGARPVQIYKSSNKDGEDKIKIFKSWFGYFYPSSTNIPPLK